MTPQTRTYEAPQRDRVRELFYEKGLRPFEIARVLQISKQRVNQHLRKIEAENERLRLAASEQNGQEATA